MILSNANLCVVQIALRDKSDPVLHQVRVEPDGTTVASDGSSFMVVSPVLERPPALPDFDGEDEAQEQVVREEGIGLVPEVATQAKRDIPKGALGIELGFAVLTKCGEGRQASAELTTTNLNRNLKVEGKKAKRRFPEWRQPLREGRSGTGTDAHARRVCVNRKALIRLLNAIDSAAPDPENLVFIEIPEGDSTGMVLRARNVVTGQSVVGLAMSMNTRGEWLELSEWERGVFEENREPLKKRPKRKVIRR